MSDTTISATTSGISNTTISATTSGMSDTTVSATTSGMSGTTTSATTSGMSDTTVSETTSGMFETTTSATTSGMSDTTTSATTSRMSDTTTSVTTGMSDITTSATTSLVSDKTAPTTKSGVSDTTSATTSGVSLDKSSEATSTTATLSWSTTASTTFNPKSGCTKSYWLPWTNRNLPDKSNGDKEFLSASELASLCNGTITEAKCATETGISAHQTGEIVRCDLENGLICSNEENGHRCMDYGITYWCECGPIKTNVTQGPEITTLSSSGTDSTSTLNSSPMSTVTTKLGEDTTSTVSQSPSSETITREEETTTPNYISTDKNPSPASSSLHTTRPESSTIVTTSQHSSVSEDSTATLPTQSSTNEFDTSTTTSIHSTSSSVTPPERLQIKCAWSPWLNTDHPMTTNTDTGDMETIVALKSKFGICPNMVDIECRIANSTTGALVGGQQGIQCDAINGLRCYNRETEEGLCYDYEVRVLCWDDEVCSGSTPLPPIETTLPTDFSTHTTVVCPPGKEWQPCAYRCSEVCHYKGRASGSCFRESVDDCVPGCKSVRPDENNECPTDKRLTDDNTCVETMACTCLRPDGSAAKPLESWTNPNNPCSKCSCFNNKLVCDSSDDCTTGQSFPTTTTTSGTTETVSSATSTTTHSRIPLCGWSSWINDDKPQTGSGDLELLSAIQSKYGFCAEPTSVECRPVTGKSVSGSNHQVRVTCNVLEGLKCYNHDNHNKCPDYEIRIFCPCPTIATSSTVDASTPEYTWTSERSSVTSTASTVSTSTTFVSSSEPSVSTTRFISSTLGDTMSSSKSSDKSTSPTVTVKYSATPEFTTHTLRMCGWTDWMSNSHPDSTGETENIHNLRKSHVFCENSAILAIRCRDVKTHKSAEALGQKNVYCDLNSGLFCLNADQDNGVCADYEVSYFCEPIGKDCSDQIQTTLSSKGPDTTASSTVFVSSTLGPSTTTSLPNRTSTLKFDTSPSSDVPSTLEQSTTTFKYVTNITQSVTSTHEIITGYTTDGQPTTSAGTSSPHTWWASTPTAVPECSDPLLLTKSYLSASSSLSLYTGPDRSRLDTHHDSFHTGAWMPKENNDKQWIKVIFPQPMMITAITTQGRESAPEWVKTYKVIYSNDNSTFHPIQTEDGHSKIFLGNTDANTKHTEYFDPIQASVIFIEPQTWEKRIALRFEIHGCYGPINGTNNTTGSTQITPTEVTPPLEIPPQDMCLKEMGMLDHRVTEQMLSASSFRDYAHAPSKARLGEDTSWIPAAYDRSPYIQVNFGKPQIISGITTQGKPDAPVYVKTFQVFYSSDGKKWSPLREDSSMDRIFYANWDSATPVTNFFLRPLRAQMIRIQPLSWNHGIALRFELHGCPVTTFTTTEATTLSVETSKSTTSTPVPGTREKCVEWDRWLDLNHPSLSTPDDIEPISDLISQSLHCQNPVAIECRTATPSQLPSSKSGQNVTCNLWEGLRCLGKDVKEPMCYNFEARIGCLKEVPECLQQSTLPPVQLCYPGIDARHCPLTCPQNSYCDGYKCVIKSDCPCALDQKVVRPSGIERNENCEVCQCLNGEIYCMPQMKCPPCKKGLSNLNMTSCDCECLKCNVDEFQCGDMSCIPSFKQCDGVVDCIDDELGCEMTTVFTPPSATTKIENDSTTSTVTLNPTTHDRLSTTSKKTTSKISTSTPVPVTVEQENQCHFLQTKKTEGGVDVNLPVSQEIVYKIGEKWSDGLCRSCSCAKGTDGEAKVFCADEDCTPCKLGEKRVKKTGSCCGVCEPYGCVVDGLVYKAGEILKSKKKCYTAKCQKDLYNNAFILQETQIECERMENLKLCPSDSSTSDHYDATGCCLVCVPPQLRPNMTSSVCETCTPRLVTGDPTKTVGYFKVTLGSGVHCHNASPIPDLKQCDGYCGSTSMYTEVMQGFDSSCKCCQPNNTTSVPVQLECSNGQFLTKHYQVPETCACMPCSGKI